MLILIYLRDEFIADPNSPTRPKWAAKTLHAAGELDGDPNDPTRTRSQFENGLCMKDPMFAEKLYLMVESDPQTYEEAAGDPICQASMNEELTRYRKATHGS